MIKKKTYFRLIVFLVAVCMLVGGGAATLALSGEEQTVPVAMAANIVKGDTTANIKKVQQRLKDLGYYKIKVDGIFGSGTRTAVRNFQRDYGLTVDGIVGARTEQALKITLTSSSSGGTVTSGDLYLLAKCIYAEARGEPYNGQVAVGAVVLNRVKSSKFPNTINGVIYQPWAFTCVNDGQINLSPNQTAINAARDAMNGWDPSNGCLYYYNPATATSKWIWSLPISIKIGRHNFARG